LASAAIRHWNQADFVASGAAGTFAACGCSNHYEYLHASRSFRSARSEQQSRSLSAPCASRLALMAPCGPSKSYKLFFMKEMLVGAVGIEIASLLHKDLHGNDLVPLPQFQLLLNVVKRKALALLTPLRGYRDGFSIPLSFSHLQGSVQSSYALWRRRCFDSAGLPQKD